VEREGVARIGGAGCGAPCRRRRRTRRLARSRRADRAWRQRAGGSPGAPRGPATPAQPVPATDQTAPQRRIEPGIVAEAGKDVLVEYQECPAKCLVDVLEHSRPQAAIGAWCKPQDAELFTCVSVVDDASVELYECRAWIVRTDPRRGIEMLRTGPADCLSRPLTPPAGSTAG
jgi:hypothetical protein